MGTLPKRRPIGLLHSVACLTAVFLLQLSQHGAMSVTLRGGVDLLDKRVADTLSSRKLLVDSASSQQHTIASQKLSFGPPDVNFMATEGYFNRSALTAAYEPGLPLLDEGMDIWIIAGQSNAVGENPYNKHLPCCQPVPGKLLTFNMLNNDANAWSDAAPCVGCISRGANPAWSVSCGPELAFGRVLLQYGVSRRVGFVPTAWGGTSLHDDWCVGCKYYNEMVDATRRALAAAGPRARLRGMIWVQGESDTGMEWDANDYATNFGRFLEAARSAFADKHPALPVLMGVMSTANRQRVFPHINTVRQRQLEFMAPNVVKVDMEKYEFYSETLRHAYKPEIVFQDVSVHLTKRGQCAMGGDMATAYANSDLHH